MKLSIFKTGPVFLNSLLLSGVLMFSFASCSKTEQKNDGEKLPIRISAEVRNMTKASDTSFDEGDQIGLSVVRWNGVEAPDLTGNRVEDNNVFSFKGGAFIPDAAAYFPDSESKTAFFAYYPYNRVEGFNSGANTFDIMLDNRQNTAERYTSNDYMFAVAEEVMPTSENVPMVFRHVLSKIVVKLVAGEGYTESDMSGAKVQLRRFNTNGVYDVVNGTFSDVENIGNIDMFNNNGIASAVVIPQQIQADENLIYITVGENVYAYKTDKVYDFETGKINEFTATINKASVQNAMLCRVAVHEWN